MHSLNHFSNPFNQSVSNPFTPPISQSLSKSMIQRSIYSLHQSHDLQPIKFPRLSIRISLIQLVSQPIIHRKSIRHSVSHTTSHLVSHSIKYTVSLQDHTASQSLCQSSWWIVNSPINIGQKHTFSQSIRQPLSLPDNIWPDIQANSQSVSREISQSLRLSQSPVNQSPRFAVSQSVTNISQTITMFIQLFNYQSQSTGQSQTLTHQSTTQSSTSTSQSFHLSFSPSVIHLYTQAFEFEEASTTNVESIFLIYIRKLSLR